MKDEIIKLYENANIKAKEYCDRDSDACMACCPEWENRQDCWKYKSVMPPFTAEKQIELIKWLIASGECYFAITIKPDEFEEYLAEYINNMWKDLADVDKEQIREILR